MRVRVRVRVRVSPNPNPNQALREHRLQQQGQVLQRARVWLARRRAQRVGDGDLERGELLGEEGRRHVLGRARGRQLRRVSAVQLPGRAEQRRGRREAGQLRQAQVDRVVPRLQPYV